MTKISINGVPVDISGRHKSLENSFSYCATRASECAVMAEESIKRLDMLDNITNAAVEYVSGNDSEMSRSQEGAAKILGTVGKTALIVGGVALSLLILGKAIKLLISIVKKIIEVLKYAVKTIIGFFTGLFHKKIKDMDQEEQKRISDIIADSMVGDEWKFTHLDYEFLTGNNKIDVIKKHIETINTDGGDAVPILRNILELLKKNGTKDEDTRNLEEFMKKYGKTYSYQDFSISLSKLKDVETVIDESDEKRINKGEAYQYVKYLITKIDDIKRIKKYCEDVRQDMDRYVGNLENLNTMVDYNKNDKNSTGAIRDFSVYCTSMRGAFTIGVKEAKAIQGCANNVLKVIQSIIQLHNDARAKNEEIGYLNSLGAKDINGPGIDKKYTSTYK